MAKKKGNENKPVYPSRANTKYVAVPTTYHDALAEYASKHSTPDDKKSVSWAARVAIRKLMDAAGIQIPSK